MTENAEHVIDALAAYALGSLDEAEHGRVEAHVAICASCAGRLAEYRAVVGVLPLALTPVAPPGLWDAIRTDAHRARKRRRIWKGIAALHSYRPARWLAAAVVGAVLLTWNLWLQTELTRYAQGPQVEKLARRPARLVILTGAAQPQASARIFAAVDGRSGHMAITGLPVLPQGRVYQLWFVPKAATPAQAAATFSVDGDGRAWVVIKVPVDLDDSRAVIVTEQAAGSSTPNGPPLLEAQKWR